MDLTKFGIRVGKKIGSGSFGDTFEVEYRGEKYAAKINKKPSIDDFTEIDIMTRIRNKYICRIVALIPQLSNQLSGQILIMPLGMGNLKKHLDRKPTFKELLVTLHQILQGINCMHSNGILHLDLKSDNIVMVETEDGYYPMIIDFGLSVAVKSIIDGFSVNKVFGTATYKAPELFDKFSSRECIRQRSSNYIVYRGSSDIWSFGVIVFRTLIGSLFPNSVLEAYQDGDEDETAYANFLCLKFKDPETRISFLTGKINASKFVPKNYKSKLLDLLDSCFQYDEFYRLSSADLLNLDIFKNLQLETNPCQYIGLSYTRPSRSKYPAIIKLVDAVIKFMTDEKLLHRRLQAIFHAVDMVYRYALEVDELDQVEIISNAICLIAVRYDSGNDKQITHINVDMDLVNLKVENIIKVFKGVIYRRFIYDSIVDITGYQWAIKRLFKNPSKYYDEEERYQHIPVNPTTYTNPELTNLTIGSLF